LQDWRDNSFHPERPRRAFSMVELVVVISVSVALMGLLMPAMTQIRENAHRVICASNQRSLGQGIFLFAGEKKDHLPPSLVLQENQSPRELMASRRSKNWPNSGRNDGWDGLGLLFYEGFCPAPECFYCPSHHGNNPFERFEEMWRSEQSTTPIYTNYHYCGDRQWAGARGRRTLDEGYSLVLVTDGLRSAQDFSHNNGMNMLHGDGSVRWRDNVQRILPFLPLTDVQPPTPHYDAMWNEAVESN
jgi:prepilin-type processing-associated H-X9-DG protein